MRVFVLALFAAAGVGGCSHIEVEVDAYRSELPFPGPSPEEGIYVETSSPDAPALLAREVERVVIREMKKRGYSCIDDPKKANYALAVTFGIGGGRTETRRVPETSRYHDTTLYYGVGGYHGSHYTRGSVTTYTTEAYQVYDRWLLATLLDRDRYDRATERDRDEAIVWQGHAMSTGTSRDLRRYVRYLLAAVFDHFGDSTYGRAVHRYGVDDESAERFAPSRSAASPAESASEGGE